MPGPIGHSGPRDDYSRWSVLWRTVVWGTALTVAFTVPTTGLVVFYASFLTKGLVGWWWIPFIATTPMFAFVSFMSMYDHADHCVGKWAGTGWESSFDYSQKEPFRS